MSEIWKPLSEQGFSFYEVSSDGRVRSKPKQVRHFRGGTRKRSGKLLTPSGVDYLHVVLRNDSGAYKTKMVHRLVAEAFLENTECKRIVNHIDGNKHNNILRNLEWLTSSENTRHAYEKGLMSAARGSNHGHSRFTEEDISAMRSRHSEGESQSSIARYYKTTQSVVSRIVRRQAWSHV